MQKPIGAISLYGAKNSESIGAAILRRNQTQSSTSSNESDDNEPKPQTIIKKDNTRINKTVKAKQEIPQISKPEISKDIFDDLFAKSEILQKKEAKKKEKVADVNEKVVEQKVDLFNDNLFDDIDDIFSSNIVKSKKEKDGNDNKSLFDENDDLFTDIAVTKATLTEENKTNLDKSNTQSIFDSDDDLFTEKPVMKTEKKEEIVPRASDTKVNPKDSSLFDSDDDDIFSSKSKTGSKKKHDVIITERTNDNLFNKHENKSAPDQTTKTKVRVDLLKEDLDYDLCTNLTETATNDTPLQFKPSGKMNPVIRSHLVNDDSELFTSTSKKIDDYKNDFIKSDEKSHKETHSSLKDGGKNPDGNTLLEDDALEKQNDAEDSLNYTKIISNKKYVNKSDDDPFSKDILQEVEQNIDIKEYENSSIENSKSKQFKSTFSDIMDDDDSDIFSNNKDKPQIEDKSKVNNKSASKIQDILKDESSMKGDEELFKTNSLGTDIAKDVSGDRKREMKPTISQKPISETRNTAETVDSSITNRKQKTVVNTEPNTLKSKINKNTTQNFTNFYENISNFAENDKPDNMQDVDKNKNLTDKQSVADNLLPEENMSHFDTPPVLDTHKSTFEEIFNESSKLEPDLFTDIFNDQPPIFEKPKEPKKSQNVNALFDDDSDDEALFFKKNDVILHDHPDEFSPDISEDRFDIFHDEPPAIDVVQETSKSDEIVPEQSSGIIFKHKVQENTINLNENLFESRQHIIVKGDNEKSKNNIDDLESVFDDQVDVLPAELKAEKKKTEKQVILKTDELSTNVDKTDGVQNEPKRIGKLKPMNFNINVNTLLPGASPKKVQNIEQADEQTMPVNNNEELRTHEVSEQDGPKLVKSVSFENEPDSKILDNKLSKDRVKIQVKRRPSTRRARREAVKKSGIDFGEDSTDNSSSIDDHIKESKIEAEKQTDVTIPETTDVSEHISLQKPDGNVKSVRDSKNTAISKDVSSEDTYMRDSKTEGFQFSKDTTLESIASSPIKDVKSKVVYILNDEDIFNSNPELGSIVDADVTKVDSVKVIDTEPTNFKLASPHKVTIADPNIVVKTESKTESKTKQILDIVSDGDDDDDIFKSMVTKSETKTNIQPETIKRLGKKFESAFNSDSDDDIFKQFTNVKKKETTLKNESTEITVTKTEQKAIFDDLSDEGNDVFNKNRKEFKASTNKILFGSDSDEELFSGKKKDKKREEVKEKKIEIKGSLFGDDDNCELFSSKDKKNTGKSNINMQ